MRRSAANLVAAGLVATLLTAPADAAAQEDATPMPEPESELTVYRDGLAQMTMRRDVDLPRGPARLAMSGISPGAIPESLHLDGENIRLSEQRLSPWPVNRQRLLQAYLGETVAFLRPAPDGRGWREEEAELIAIDEGVVLRIDDRIEVDPIGRIVFPDLPESMGEAPEATFRIESASEGERTLTLRYLMHGVSWRVDYAARWREAESRLDLTAIATLTNDLTLPVGADGLRLVAGEVARADDAPVRPMARDLAMTAEAAATPPEAESLGDLAVYTLDGPVTVDPGARLQLGFIEARDVEVEARYRLTGLAVAQPMREVRRANAHLRLEIEDTREAGIDEPLPAGTMRVYADDVFRGERRIADTPSGAPLRLDLGHAFDITAEARQTDFERIGERAHESAHEVLVRNAKDRAVTVHVVGAFPPDWRMIEESAPHDRQSATEPVWAIEVPAEGETRLTYRVRVQR